MENDLSYLPSFLIVVSRVDETGRFSYVIPADRQREVLSCVWSECVFGDDATKQIHERYEAETVLFEADMIGPEC